MSFKPAEDLYEVIDLLQDMMSWIVKNRKDFLPDTYKEAQKAWNEIQKNDEFRKLQDEIKNKISQHQYSQLFDKSGLNKGALLSYKLASLNSALQDFLEAKEDYEEDKKKGKPKGKVKKKKRGWLFRTVLTWTNRVLKRIDIILESILKSLGAPNPIEEIKKMIEEDISLIAEEGSEYLDNLPDDEEPTDVVTPSTGDISSEPAFKDLKDSITKKS